MAKKGPSTIQDRLHRIEGQIRGIEKLIDSGAPVEQVTVQIQAVISSLESAKLELIKQQMRDALMAQVDRVTSLLK
jgi:DNA-binding FrmR family transcriptional regulator